MVRANAACRIGAGFISWPGPTFERLQNRSISPKGGACKNKQRKQNCGFHVVIGSIAQEIPSRRISVGVFQRVNIA